jgi:hypothetical protein
MYPSAAWTLEPPLLSPQEIATVKENLWSLGVENPEQIDSGFVARALERIEPQFDDLLLRGPTVAPLLQNAYEAASDSEIRARALYLLSLTAEPQQVKALLPKAADSEHPNLRAAAAAAAISLAGDAPAGLLDALAQDRDSRVSAIAQSYSLREGMPGANARRLTRPDISNLDAATENVCTAFRDTDRGPPDPENYNQLSSRLGTAKGKLPPLYRETMHDPYVNVLAKLGQSGFTDILSRAPDGAQLMMDIAHGILQNSEGYKKESTDALLEVVSDLYDGFLSAEDRKGVQLPDRGVYPPLVKWGRPEKGPYTFPVDATAHFGCKAAVVNFPPSHARGALLGWAALAHETAGHDILHADTGLKNELARAISDALTGVNSTLSRYWSQRVDETASDVLGILNMGPAAGIGLIGYFRGANKASTGSAKLRNTAATSDPHPIDVLRGLLAAETVRLLEFRRREVWATEIETETRKDFGPLEISGIDISFSAAKEMARAVARAIVNTPTSSLEHTALGDIQNWRDSDEETVRELQGALSGKIAPERVIGDGIYAAHVVAAAVTSAISANTDVNSVFQRMVITLKLMHDKNPSWSPLFVAAPGSLRPHLAYQNEAKVERR